LAPAAGEKGVDGTDTQVDLAGGAPRRRMARGPAGSGPLPSTGSPKALTTRPSQARVGRTVGSLSASSARRPSPTPSSVPKDMASARPARNPTTSQGTRRRLRSITSQREPM